MSARRKWIGEDSDERDKFEDYDYSSNDNVFYLFDICNYKKKKVKENGWVF